MAKRRRLSDLYVTGKPVTIGDGQGGEVTVYLQKLNPLDNEQALKKAGAARSRVLAWGKKPDSDEYLSVQSEVWDIKDTETLVEYLIQEDLVNKYSSAEAELAADEEWSKDNYYDGLKEAWENGLSDTWAADPEDEDAKRVYVELTRFNDTVNERVESDAEKLRRDWQGAPEDTLREKVTEKFIKMRGDMEWLREFRKQELFLSTREPENHKKLYFENRAEVDGLAPEVFKRLMDEYESLNVDVHEGKDLPVTPDSSPSSEASEKEETEQPSGPVIVTA
jgi:hypothetical protein